MCAEDPTVSFEKYWRDITSILDKLQIPALTFRGNSISSPAMPPAKDETCNLVLHTKLELHCRWHTIAYSRTHCFVPLTPVFYFILISPHDPTPSGPAPRGHIKKSDSVVHFPIHISTMSQSFKFLSQTV